MSILFHNIWHDCSRYFLKSNLRAIAFGFAVVAIAFTVSFDLSIAADVEPQQVESEIASYVDERFLANAIRSTSLETPGAASQVPLSDTTVLSGTILDADGSPAVGADVWTASTNMIPGIRELAKTDEQGNFELHLSYMAHWRVRAFKGNMSVDVELVNNMHPLAAEPSHNRTKNRLVTQCSMQVKALDKENNPVAGTRIYVDDGRVAISDQDGVANIDALTQGTHQVVARGAGYAVERLSFHCTQGKENRLDIHLEKANAVYGQILDAQGDPVGDAWLSRRGTNSSSVADDGTYTLADNRGRFVGDDLPATKDSVMNDLLLNTMRISQVGASGFQSTAINTRRFKASEPTKLCVILQERSVTPVESLPGVPMIIDPMGLDNPSETVPLFAIGNQRQPIPIHGGLAGYTVPSHLQVIAPQAKQRQINGRVVDEAGRPVHNFGVSVECLNPLRPITGGVTISILSANDRIQYTDNDGRFTITDATSADGRYRVTVDSQNSMEAVREVVVSHEETHGQSDEFLFTLKKPKHLTLKISSAASSGSQESNIEAATVATITSQLSMTINPDGTLTRSKHPQNIFEVSENASIPVRQSKGKIAIQAPGYARHYFDWNADESKYDIKLLPEAKLRLSIQTDILRTIPEIHLQLTGIDNTNVSLEDVFTDTYERGNLAQGWYKVVLKHGPYQIAKKDLFLKAGEDTLLNYRNDFEGNMSESVTQHARIQVPEDVKFSVNGRYPENSTLTDFTNAIKRHVGTEPSSPVHYVTDEQLRDALRSHLEYLKTKSADAYHSKHVVPALQEMVAGKSWPPSAAFLVESFSHDVISLKFMFPTPTARESSYFCTLKIVTNPPTGVQ